MAYDIDQDDRHGGGAAFLVGLLMGAAVGAGLALLYAPKSGRETRDDIKDQAKKAREAAAGQYQHGREKVHQAVDRGKDAYGKARGVVQRTKEDIKTNVQELVGTGTGTS